MHQDLHNSLRVRARSTAVEQRHSAAAAEPVTVRIEPRDFHSGEGERATAPAHHCARGITSARWTLRRRRQVGARRGCPPRGPANPSRARPRKATWQSSPHRTVSVLDPTMAKSAISGELLMLTSWASWSLEAVPAKRSARLLAENQSRAKPRHISDVCALCRRRPRRDARRRPKWAKAHGECNQALHRGVQPLEAPWGARPARVGARTKGPLASSKAPFTCNLPSSACNCPHPS